MAEKRTLFGCCQPAWRNENRRGIMVKGSSIARLKERAEKMLKKDPERLTYKEIKDISNWTAIPERWESMKGNQYASGLIRKEKTLEKMRSAQRARRKKEIRERLLNAKCRASSSEE
jgi:hypothetical protein